MTLKVIYTEVNEPMWVDLAEEMSRRCGWEAVYWAGLPSVEEQVRRRLPAAVFHDKVAAIKALPAPGLASLPSVPLDQTLLAGLAVCEGMVLRMLDRMDPWNDMGLRDRLDLYQRFVGYWSAVLDHLRPDLVFFPLPPHMAYDYVLYALCQQRGLPTVVLEHAMIASRVFLMERFEDRETPMSLGYQRLLRQQGPDSAEPQLSPLFQQHLDDLAGRYKVPFYVQKQGNLGGKADLSGARLWLETKSLPRRLLNLAQKIKKIATTPAPHNYVKPKGQNYREAGLTHWRFEYYQWLGRRYRRRLRNAYEALAAPVDCGAPYVFLAMHYQPEMSSMPMGGYLEEQRVLARLIAGCLPEGWRLYIKEHPVQVFPTGKGHYSRSPGYYRDLLEIPKVSLAPLATPSFELIDQAKAVVTITGQAGWEAINRGVPVLLAGQAWYRGCEGCFAATDRQSVREALEAIAQGYQVDPRKVRLFVKAVEQETVPAYVVSIFGQQYGVSAEENQRNLAALLESFSRSHYPAAHGQP